MNTHVILRRIPTNQNVNFNKLQELNGHLLNLSHIKDELCTTVPPPPKSFVTFLISQPFVMTLPIAPSTVTSSRMYEFPMVDLVL